MVAFHEMMQEQHQVFDQNTGWFSVYSSGVTASRSVTDDDRPRHGVLGPDMEPLAMATHRRGPQVGCELDEKGFLVTAPLKFFHSSLLNHAPKRVWDWYSSPGALTRLTPQWLTTVVEPPTNGLQPGSRTHLVHGAPWVDAVVSMVPGLKHLTPVGTSWVAEHTTLEPGVSFTDEMVSGPLASWEHIHRFVPSGTEETLVCDEITYEFPGDLREVLRLREEFEEQLERVFRHRSRVVAGDLNFHTDLAWSRPLTVVIAGASGLVGTQLVALLTAAGHRVIRLQRRRGESRRLDADRFSWDPARHQLDSEVLEDADAVINLAGASIVGVMTEKHRNAIFASRVQTNSTLVAAMKRTTRAPASFITASASGFYGHDASPMSLAAEPITEDHPSGDDFLAAVCRQVEGIAREAEDLGIRTVAMRTGLVLSARGGLLATQLPLYFAGAGGPLGPGTMWMPWIGLDDLIQLYVWAVTHDSITGPLNAVAPAPVQQREFAEVLGEVITRPTRLPTPGWAPALVLGRQGNRELAMASARLSAEKALASGYRFRAETIDEAIRQIFGR